MCKRFTTSTTFKILFLFMNHSIVDSHCLIRLQGFLAYLTGFVFYFVMDMFDVSVEVCRLRKALFALFAFIVFLPFVDISYMLFKVRYLTVCLSTFSTNITFQLLMYIVIMRFHTQKCFESFSHRLHLGIFFDMIVNSSNVTFHESFIYSLIATYFTFVRFCFRMIEF